MIGIKRGMTRVFDRTTGQSVAVTVIEAPVNQVVMVKTAERDSYDAVQVAVPGTGTSKHKPKAEAGHFARHLGKDNSQQALGNGLLLAEFRCTPQQREQLAQTLIEKQTGETAQKQQTEQKKQPDQQQQQPQQNTQNADQTADMPAKDTASVSDAENNEVQEDKTPELLSLDAAQFSQRQKVDVTGISKGKGFAGTVKRWNFRMQDATHGNSLAHRAPGSIGQCQTPGRVWKGKKMAGHLGNVRTTVQSLVVERADPDKGLVLIRGAVPGAKGSPVRIVPTSKGA